MKTKNKFTMFGLCLFFVFILSSNKVRAASLYFSPASGNFAVEDMFSVNLFVDTDGAAINNVEARVEFPTEFLNVVSVSQSASIFSLWIQPIFYSNSAGTIIFNGGLPTPGYTGSSGRIFSVVFQAKKTGTASLILSSTFVRANDGLGTDILTSAESVQYNLGAPLLEKKAEAPARPRMPAPSAPEISSLTHPDQNKWYALKEAKFTWALPSEVNAMRFSVDALPAASPTIIYTPPVKIKELTNMGDGVWYFHTQFRNQAGWGRVAHYRFQIDTTAPELSAIKFIDDRETDNPRPSISFEAVDALSGVDYYKVKIDEGEFYSVSTEAVAQGKYHTLPFQNPGKKTILVQAFDRAGNSATVKDEFIVTALAPPKFTDYPKELRADEILFVKGETIYPQAQIVVWLESESGLRKQIVISGDDGLFVFVVEEKLLAGVYKMWAEVFDERGAKSTPSEELTIVVTLGAVYKALPWTMIVLVLVASLIIIIFILLLLLWRTRRKFRATLEHLGKRAKKG